LIVIVVLAATSAAGCSASDAVAPSNCQGKCDQTDRSDGASAGDARPASACDRLERQRCEQQADCEWMGQGTCLAVDDWNASSTDAAIIKVITHRVVDHGVGEFSAWPANRGAQQWVWGDEMLVGFINGTYKEKEGHNWDPPLSTRHARTTDGGLSWTLESRDLEPGGPAPGAIDFTHPGFALYVDDDARSFILSYDRGKTWHGPHGFGQLLSTSPLDGKEFTSRTDYIVNSSKEAFFFMSSRNNGWIDKEDYTYMAKSSDGGATFSFVSRIAPGDLDRNVMPSSVRVSPTRLVTCVRRNRDKNDTWIECYRSEDDGASWSSTGQVDDTGVRNGNPPALVRTPNGRLVCVYGVRRDQRSSISAKVSSDDGKRWSIEQRLRSDFVGPDAFGDTDLGYPRAFVRPDGKVVAVYYWATKSRPEQHIEATIFKVIR
jgi:hypothetical protein